MFQSFLQVENATLDVLDNYCAAHRKNSYNVEKTRLKLPGSKTKSQTYKQRINVSKKFE